MRDLRPKTITPSGRAPGLRQKIPQTNLRRLGGGIEPERLFMLQLSARGIAQSRERHAEIIRQPGVRRRNLLHRFQFPFRPVGAASFRQRGGEIFPGGRVGRIKPQRLLVLPDRGGEVVFRIKRSSQAVVNPAAVLPPPTPSVSAPAGVRLGANLRVHPSHRVGRSPHANRPGTGNRDRGRRSIRPAATHRTSTSPCPALARTGIRRRNANSV